MDSHTAQNLPMLGLMIGLSTIVPIGVVLMIAHLCRQLAARMRVGPCLQCRQEAE